MNESALPKDRPNVRALIDAECSSAKARRRWWGVALALAAVASALLVVAVRWSGSEGSSARYVMQPVTRGGLDVTVTATGSLQPTHKVDVSSELSGTVRQVFVDYNSRVEAGQQLAELDTDKLEATVASSRAKLEAAQARVAQAEATLIEVEAELARRKALIDRGFATTQDLEVAQAARDRAVAFLASARADVAVGEADLNLHKTELSKACICSPIDGVVLTREVDPGQTVAVSFQAPVLFTIAEDLAQMEAQVDVDEADVGQVRPGQPATFTVDAFPARRFPATIRDVRFASETVQGVVTYKAILDVDNSELLLRPGMTATADIVVREVRDALLIPNAGLRYAPSAVETGSREGFLSRLMPRPPRFTPPSAHEPTGRERTVWTLRDGRPAEVLVEIGASDGTRTEVVGGELNEGEAVIVDEAAPPG
jgi:HlyD family secretion protein